MKFIVYCTTTRAESAEIEAENEEEAIHEAEMCPDNYDWNEIGEYENEYYI